VNEWSARRSRLYLHNIQETQETKFRVLGGNRTPQPQPASGRRPTPYTSWTLGWALILIATINASFSKTQIWTSIFRLKFQVPVLLTDWLLFSVLFVPFELVGVLKWIVLSAMRTSEVFLFCKIHSRPEGF